MRVAAVQFDIVWEDKPANHRRIEGLLDSALVPSGALVVLPELGDTGFSFDLDAIVDDQTLRWATALARERAIWLQAGHAEVGPDGRGRNVAVLVAPDGSIAGRYAKVHPFSFGREADHFSGGDRLLVARLPDTCLCPLICYDLRFPELWRLGATAGAELFALGASWPNARQAHWRTLLHARAIENQAFVIGVNRVGADPHLAYDGGSIIVAPDGRILAEAGDEPAVLQAEVDLAELREWRSHFPALRDVRPGLLGSIETDVIETTATSPGSEIGG